MKFLNIMLITVFIFGVESLNAKRMDAQTFVKQRMDQVIKELESTINDLESFRKEHMVAKEGIAIGKLTSQEAKSIDNSITRLQKAIDILSKKGKKVIKGTPPMMHGEYPPNFNPSTGQWGPR